MALTPRQERVLKVLLDRPVMREHLDIIAGCSNGPDLVAGLRRKGLAIPCYRVERIDKDGRSCFPGEYSLASDDKALVRTWLEG